jgi:hypothetical protein
MIQVRRHTLPECQIHQILSNPRRRAILQHLGSSSSGVITVRALSESIAAAEAGESPAPRNVRESVYTSLHQTHLPKLDALGVIEYDRDHREIRVLDRARDVDRYMDVVTGAGVTWGEYYLGLGVFSLVMVVTALAGVPGISLIDPLLWASGALATFALSAVYQLWSDRWAILRLLRR